jgi:hypothetical protein
VKVENLWIMDDDEKCMVKAQMDYCGERGWGLNEAAIAVLNTVLLSVEPP